MAFVPELSYGVTEAASVADACAAPDQAAARGGETPGQSTRETGQRTNPKPMRQDVGAGGGRGPAATAPVVAAAADEAEPPSEDAGLRELQ